MQQLLPKAVKPYRAFACIIQHDSTSPHGPEHGGCTNVDLGLPFCTSPTTRSQLLAAFENMTILAKLNA